MLRHALGRAVFVSAIAVVPVAASRPGSPAAPPALKSHHLLNLPTSLTEADFVATLRDLNHAVVQTGYPRAGYRLWKVTGQQAGSYAYLLEGEWPSQAAYDSIHAHPAYRAAAERARTTFQTALRDRLYNRYLEIPLGRTGAP